ncbi:MAG: hypothetical protein JW818_08200, partial [Pirellulales bacterium]|nr:hypothetical protein [Pirellulales bacterium]
GQSAAGLNYFFHDELQFGVGDRIWADDLPAEFARRKGYDLFEALPAMFQDVGSKTAKYRLDFMDVKMQLAQQRYFVPIFQWHWSRGKIYGCDQGSRGRNPLEFGDYFSAVRWYTAPGHDTPGGSADLIKGKVSSSIAQLYGRPRVWLEGYHSLGWSATPERLMYATRENYLYGCTLLSLHGLYYTTHGGYWEWAPPCYHFRMPYWDHIGVFLKYFERLSYLMSQGVHQCDVAVLYPVSPHQAGLGGEEATRTAFAAAERLYGDGRDFIFIDDQSLDRTEIRDGRLHVAGASYRVLVLPAMRAVRWLTLQKALAFHRAGGLVIAVGALPEASDRAGSDDPVLDTAVRELFGATAAEVKQGKRPTIHTNPSGGTAGLVMPGLPPGRKPRRQKQWDAPDADWTMLAKLLRSIPHDVVSARPVKTLHRKIGPRDVYMVMGAARGSECTFRAKGHVELWDPWTGQARPLVEVSPTPEGTKVRMPLEDYEAQLIVFSPGEPGPTVTRTDLDDVTSVDVSGGEVRVSGYVTTPGPKTATVRTGTGQTIEVRGVAPKSLAPIALDGPWEFELKPTLDNRWGDFRLPATQKLIGPEARRFCYAQERSPNPGWQDPGLDDSRWAQVTRGFGLKFWKLGPLPADTDTEVLDKQLAALERIDPDVPVRIGNKKYRWKPYDFSWRWGKEGDPGHQGFHGLKKNVTDDFICLGRPRGGHNETRYIEEPGGTRYYLWTTVPSKVDTKVAVTSGGLKPAAAYVNGQRAAEPLKLRGLQLRKGVNPLLLRYDAPGRGHFVVVHPVDPSCGRRTPLAMKWYDNPSLVPLDALPSKTPPVGWYRFVAPPGLRGMTVHARGEVVQAWADGKPMTVKKVSERVWEPVVYRFSLDKPIARAATVALRIRQERGYYGGSTLPEPIELDCAAGRTTLGDWSRGSALESYSGGAWYRKTVTLSPEQTEGRVTLDLGQVVATAEVRVNGRPAGVQVAPPWTLDISRLVKPGDNRIEILVYNTLANQYLTVPTRYRGSLHSGLIGPVRLTMEKPVVLSR